MGAIHITIEGIPVEEVIAAQESAEVESSRREEIRSVSFRKTIVTKNQAKSSNRSGKGRSLMSAGLVDSRVLCQMFINGGLNTTELGSQFNKLVSLEPKKQMSATQMFYKMDSDQRRAYLQSQSRGM